MMGCISLKNESVIMFVLWIIATFVIVDPQFHQIHSKDLQIIVDDLKKDVDNYLKMTPAGRRIEDISLPTPPEVEESATDSIVKSIKESMHHHMIRNLGPPSKLKNGITVDSVPTSENTFGATSSSTTFEPVTNEDSLDASEEVYEVRVGSIKGVPGVNFPDYHDIPSTSFTCFDKPFHGFYADLDAGCQVFHVCWPDRRESFLCPTGTIYNQALRVCDYWYNVNCSLAPYYYTVNAELDPDSSKEKNEETSSMINVLLEKSNSDLTAKKDSTDIHRSESVLSFASEFMPVKAKIVVYPKTAKQRSKIVASATIGESSKPNKSSERKKPTHSRQSKHIKTQTGTRMAELKSNIFAVRFTEALKNLLTSVKNDNSVSKLSKYVESVVKFLQSIYEDHKREPFDIEPENDLYDYAFNIRQSLEFFQTIVKKLLISAANFIDEIELDRISGIPNQETSHRISKREAVKHATLTHLNHKFIIKPATKQAFRAATADKPVKETKHVQTDEKYLELKPKKRLHIYTATQKALLKNYITL